jgi:hypothetical protein
MSPTLLELGGYDVPNSMQGKSLVSGKTLKPRCRRGFFPDQEEIIRERLSGLGYIS